MANGDTNINTGGGASTGDVRAGGDFVGRDQTNININVVNWIRLGVDFIDDLDKALQAEQKKQQELGPHSTKEIQNNIDELTRKLTELKHFNWAKAEDAYLNKVIKLYDRVRILGHSEDVPLGNVFTQVYILDKPTALQRYDIDELRKRGWDRSNFQHQLGQRTQGLELVQTNRNLFILGKPGAGKTTFLKYIMVQAARKLLPRVPIFVSLNQWADSQWGKGTKAALLPFIIEQFAICDFPHAELFIDYILKKGRALVLFDGLDEVKQEQEQRRRLTRLLQDFAYKYDKSQHLITCRIAASDYAFAGFADVEVADFTPNQVREYAQNWFGDNKKKFLAFTSELADPENQGLAELCRTPLLLALLCLTFDNNIRFPPSRAELYEDALETLLRKWDSSREIQRDEIYRALSFKRKVQLLMSIAKPTFEKGELFFRQRDLEQRIVAYLAKLPGALSADIIDGTIILKAIESQHSILVERAQGIYSFSHLTLQEYLTARYLAENQGGGLYRTLIRHHLADQRWREVFLLTATLLDDANEFVAVLRSLIDGLVTDSPVLRQLLTWADGRTQRIEAPVERRFTVQLAYIFLALAHTRALDLALARDLDLALEIASVSNLAPALALASDLARSLYSATAFDLDLARSFDRSLDLARSTTELVGFDYGLYYSWGYATLLANSALDRNAKNWQTTMQQFPNLVQGIAVLAHKAGLVSLMQALEAQPIPLPTAGTQDWQHYADLLLVMLRDQRGLGQEWNFSAHDEEKLNYYFYFNELLVQCLKVAAVTDRQAVLNSLLLPPPASKDQASATHG